MLTKFLVATGSAIAACSGFAATAIAQSSPPTVQIGGVDYAIEFKLGVFEKNIIEIQAQPWYAKNDFTLATEVTRQVFGCAAGSPFDKPICTTPFNAFGNANINTGFGGLSPWFIYDVESGVAATAVGFSEVSDGNNVLSQINANLASEQSYAIATRISSSTPDMGAVPEPTSWVAIITVGVVMGGSWLRQKRSPK